MLDLQTMVNWAELGWTELNWGDWNKTCGRGGCVEPGHLNSCHDNRQPWNLLFSVWKWKLNRWKFYLSSSATYFWNHDYLGQCEKVGLSTMTQKVCCNLLDVIMNVQIITDFICVHHIQELPITFWAKHAPWAQFQEPLLASSSSWQLVFQCQ